MFEPKCDWWRKIRWEDKTVLLKGILSIKRKDYGRFVELALDAGMRGALVGDYDVESQSGEFWFDAEKEDPRIWRYTFDGEKMYVQDGRFVFD